MIGIEEHKANSNKLQHISSCFSKNQGGTCTKFAEYVKRNQVFAEYLAFD